MLMKKGFRKTGSILLAFLLAGSLQAQSLQWPIAGKKEGEDILSRPQAYISGELNYEDLVIGAEPGTAVLCPANGIIVSVGTVYQKSMNYIDSYGFDARKTMAENIRAAREESGKPCTGSLSLRLADGKKVHLQGFTGDRRFQTGQAMKSGDTLGVVDYSFPAFKKPSLMVSISDTKGKAVDPMTPFGLMTSFVEAEAITRDNPMPADKIREDLDVLENAFCELYPSLESHMSEAAFRAYMDSLKASVTGPMDVPMDFRLMLRRILHRLPDSHVYLYPDPIQTEAPVEWTPGEMLTFCDDTVRVMIAAQGFEALEGKVVTTIDGVPAAAYARRAAELETGYDGKIESTTAERLVYLARYSLMLNPDAAKGTVHELGLEDGMTVRVPFYTRPLFRTNDQYRRIYNWYSLNLMRGDDDVFETRVLNDSTAYLAIRTFELLDKQVEQIRDFLRDCKAPNLIVDVRNNGGGESAVMMQLLSYFADAPMDRQKGGYMRVLKQGHFASLDHSVSYNGTMDIFPEYEAGDNGFYKRDSLETCAVVMPDPDVHYSGKVYVLTNGHSVSAATLFPAILVRNRRGVSIGRETGSGYHYFTAFKQADIVLPNTLQTVRIPMVQLVFDTTVCDRLPEGRGLLPDYPLPLAWNEVMMGDDGNTDVMLEYALSLIGEGRYLSEEDPFAAADQAPVKRSVPWLPIAGAVALILLVLAIVLLRRKV